MENDSKDQENSLKQQVSSARTSMKVLEGSGPQSVCLVLN